MRRGSCEESNNGESPPVTPQGYAFSQGDSSRYHDPLCGLPRYGRVFVLGIAFSRMAKASQLQASVPVTRTPRQVGIVAS